MLVHLDCYILSLSNHHDLVHVWVMLYIGVNFECCMEVSCFLDSFPGFRFLISRFIVLVQWRSHPG